MAPRGTPKMTPKVERIIKNTKTKVSPATIKKASTKTMSEKNSSKVTKSVINRVRSTTVPIVSTPKPKENKPTPLPETVSKSGKKATWKRRPKPAHSGVPVPEKMKKLIGKQLQDSDSSF